MRRTLFALTGLSLALAAAAPAGLRAPAPPTKPAAVTATTFFVSGRGWGHGVGMSQYGALGYANEGWTYDRILAHYYTGTELGPAPVARVRVLVAEARASVKLRSTAPFRVRDVFGKTYPLATGEVVLGPRLRVTVNGTPTELGGPVVFLPGSAPLELDGRAYRGQVEVAVTAGKLNAINAVGLEQYLAGVVSQEMPSSWPAEALKAQAVAARSYALSHLVDDAAFDLYADVRSQVYGGVAAERESTTAAVEATAGQVLLWQGEPIDALFHSTSGGRTLDVEEVFGKPVPYLVGVDDPYSSLSPVDRWGPTPVPEARLRRGLKLRAPVTALELTRGRSGRVKSARVTTTTGSTTVPGSTLRFAAGLRSTWVTQLASFSITRPGGAATWGAPVTVTAKATGVEGAVLSQRVGGAWKPLKRLRATMKAQAPLFFRLSAGKLVGPVLKVPVAPRVSVARAGLTLRGVVTGLDPGATVELQLESARGWWTTVQTTTGPGGRYTLQAQEPGTYRVRVAPAQGLAAAVTRAYPLA